MECTLGPCQQEEMPLGGIKDKMFRLLMNLLHICKNKKLDKNIIRFYANPSGPKNDKKGRGV